MTAWAQIRRRWYPWGLVGVHVTIYCAGGYWEWFTITKMPRDPGLLWPLVWIPFWIAQTLEFEAAKVGPADLRAHRPEAPDARATLAGVFWAFAGANLAFRVVVSLTREVMDPVGFDALHAVVLFALLFAMVSLFAVVPRPANWVRRYHLYQRQRLAESEAALATARTRVLQSQMQPHFLFNALNTVTALLHEDPARAKSVLVSLRALLERTVAAGQRSTTTVEREVAFVRDQLAIEQERFRDRLTVSFSIDPTTRHAMIPVFSLQPLAENALRYGIAKALEGGHIHVSVERQQGRLVLAVENTGAGLDPHWKEGMGLGNLRERLAAEYGANATLTVEPMAGGGTRATITV